MIFNTQSSVFRILIISSIMLTSACAQLGLESVASENSDASSQKSVDKTSESRSISWSTSEFYTIQNDQILIYGQGISRDSLAAVSIAKQNAVSNYRMAVRELPEHEVQEIAYLSELTDDISIEILSDEGTFRAFVKAIISR